MAVNRITASGFARLVARGPPALNGVVGYQMRQGPWAGDPRPLGQAAALTKTARREALGLILAQEVTVKAPQKGGVLLQNRRGTP